MYYLKIKNLTCTHWFPGLPGAAPVNPSVVFPL